MDIPREDWQTDRQNRKGQTNIDITMQKLIAVLLHNVPRYSDLQRSEYGNRFSRELILQPLKIDSMRMNQLATTFTTTYQHHRHLLIKFVNLITKLSYAISDKIPTPETNRFYYCTVWGGL